MNEKSKYHCRKCRETTEANTDVRTFFADLLQSKSKNLGKLKIVCAEKRTVAFYF